MQQQTAEETTAESDGSALEERYGSGATNQHKVPKTARNIIKTARNIIKNGKKHHQKQHEKARIHAILGSLGIADCTSTNDR
ncbi:MAG: hypothetical protein IJV27_05055 [Prevotella sp.]|nr:hypothetical protein [Prevotella sp.]